MLKLHLAPLALATDGTLLANVAERWGVTDPATALRRAAKEGLVVFVGVPLGPPEVRAALRRLDDAAAEIVGTVQGQVR